MLVNDKSPGHVQYKQFKLTRKLQRINANNFYV